MVRVVFDKAFVYKKQIFQLKKKNFLKEEGDLKYQIFMPGLPMSSLNSKDLKCSHLTEETHLRWKAIFTLTEIREDMDKVCSESLPARIPANMFRGRPQLCMEL